MNEAHAELAALRAAYPAPLEADDPLVQRAMATIECLSPAGWLAIIRTVYRYAYAYHRNPHPLLLTEFLNTLLGSVVLHEHPEYARAVAELNELKTSLDGGPTAPPEPLNWQPSCPTHGAGDHVVYTLLSGGREWYCEQCGTNFADSPPADLPPGSIVPRAVLLQTSKGRQELRRELHDELRVQARRQSGTGKRWLIPRSRAAAPTRSNGEPHSGHNQH